MRSRSVVTPAAHGGQPCGNSSQSESCSEQECPIDCRLSPYGSWSTCSSASSCGMGMQERSRTVVVPSQHGGASCGNLTESRECDSGIVCSQNCSLGNWSEWSICSVTCGGSVQTRTRSVLSAAVGSGSCGLTTESRACGTANCPVDCVMSEFGEWSSCSHSCGGGTRHKTRRVLVSDAYGRCLVHARIMQMCGCLLT